MKNKYLKFVVITISCCILFFLCGEPFREFFKLSEQTEVRPVSAFPLIFGIAFGFAGTLGCAIGNLIADIISGYNASSFIPGFFVQLLYGYLPVLVFNHWRRHDKNKYQLNKIHKLNQFIILCLADSVFSAFLVHCLIHFSIGVPVFGLGFLNTLLNQIIFFIVIGIPFLCLASIFYQKKQNYLQNQNRLILISLNEKLILFFLFFSIITSILTSIGTYVVSYPKYSNDPLVLWSIIYFVCGAVLLLSLVPSLSFMAYIEKKVSIPLERLSSAAVNFGKEDNIQLEIEKILMKCHKYLQDSTEIGNLARSFDGMARALEDYVENLEKISAEKKQNETQLKIASAIQLGSLPKKSNFDDIEFFATIKPALEVGGDFYDYFKLDDSHLAIVIADVSGKGIPASLYMMASKIILAKNLKTGLSPAQALTKTNQELCEDNPTGMFVTCFCGIIDLKTKVFTYANAGHERPAISRNGQMFVLEKIKAGLVLGAMDETNYTQSEIQFQTGDTFFTYTDGIPEAMSPEYEEFGNDRLLLALNDKKDLPLPEIADHMFHTISDFNRSTPQSDDITMLMFRMK